jgi:probable rRNA maturation factor
VKLRLELASPPGDYAPPDLPALSREIERVMTPLFGDMSASVALSFVSDGEIRALNARYRGIDEETDVLSFPLWEEDGRFAPPPWEEIPLGDVVVSPDFVRRNAESENISYNDEMARMIAHGVLHLAGYDHDTDERRREMWALQESIVTGYALGADASGED